MPERSRVRIVIDIDGDQVKVDRVVGEELPPADILAKAATLNAESAGVAMGPGGVAAFDAIGAEPTDAGRAPSAARPRARPTKSVAPRASRADTASKSAESRRGRR